MTRLRDQQGFALVSVLWGMAILSLIALSLLSRTSVAAKLERNHWHRIQAEARMETAINRAVLALLDHNWPVDGKPRHLTLDDNDIEVTIRDEAGKIDLNRADEETLQKLFASVGLSASEAERIVACILDWREDGAFKRLNGAKASDYRMAKSSYVPRNGAFQSLDELALVLGMTPALYAKVKPALTIFSQQQNVQLDQSPPEVLKVFGDIRPNTNAGFDITGLTAPGASLAGRAISITARLSSAEPPLTKEVILRITDAPHRPFVILSWQP